MRAQLAELAQSIGGKENLEGEGRGVTLRDSFVHPANGRESHCFRVTYCGRGDRALPWAATRDLQAELLLVTETSKEKIYRSRQTEYRTLRRIDEISAKYQQENTRNEANFICREPRVERAS